MPISSSGRLRRAELEAYRLGYLERNKQSQVWRHAPVSPALRRLRQRDCHKLKASRAP